MEKKYLNIKNVSTNQVNFVIPLPGSGSKGILLSPGECVVAESSYTKGQLLKTATLGIQERRGLIVIEENFNNDLYGFELNKNLKTEDVEKKVNLLEAEENAKNYMKS